MDGCVAAARMQKDRNRGSRAGVAYMYIAGLGTERTTATGSEKQASKQTTSNGMQGSSADGAWDDWGCGLWDRGGGVRLKGR